MKIVCPSCEATYEVPEVVLTSRRKMRCARCGQEWVPGDVAAAEAEALRDREAAAMAVPPARGIDEAHDPREAPPEPAFVPATAAKTSLEPVPASTDGDATGAHAADELPPAMAPEPPVVQRVPGPEADSAPHLAGHVGAADPAPEELAPEELAPHPVTPEPVVPQHVAIRPVTPVTVMPQAAPVSAINPATLTVKPAQKGQPVLAWAGSVAILAAAVVAFVMLREPVMKAWPPSGRLYAAIGLAGR